MKSTTKRPRQSPQKKVFSDDELEAMQAAKVERKKGKDVDLEPDLLAKVKELKGLDRELAEKLHAIVKAAAPDSAQDLVRHARLGRRNGKIVCFFTPRESSSRATRALASTRPRSSMTATCGRRRSR